MSGAAFNPDVPPVPLGAEGTVLTIVQGGPKFNSTASNVTPDTVPGVPTPWNDEFTGAIIDLTGSRFPGANAWSWLNQGTSVATLTGGSLLLVGQVGVGVALSALIQPLSGAGTTWSFVTKIAYAQFLSGAQTGGFVLYNSANNHILTWGLVNNTNATFSAIIAQRFTDPNTFSATVAGPGNAGQPQTLFTTGYNTMDWLYLKVFYDSVNINLQMSANGLQYQTIYSETPAAFLGAVPTHIGLGDDNNSASAATIMFDYFRKVA